MRIKILSKQTLLTATLLGLVFFAVLLLGFSPKGSTQISSTTLIENRATPSSQEHADTELPMRLRIPQINVNASIEYVGLTSEGAMDTPKDPSNVAWFNLGVRPGENGSAVIAGHAGWKNHRQAVFDNLHKLSKGDKLYIEDEGGVTSTFVVREIRIYNPNKDASLIFNSNDGKAYLNLITCKGVWNEQLKTYSERLVIFTEKE